MKKLLLTAVCVMALSNLQTMAQGYSTLWKQVIEAQEKDLPKTEIEVLEKIAKKAHSENAYGQLLKAQLRRAAVQTQVSPDSIDVEFERVKANMETAEKKGNRVLAAVYQSILGRLYKDRSNGNGYYFANDDPDRAEYKKLSAEYYAKSMEPVELLAQQQSKGYEPTLIEGSDSRIFGGDLLHVLGIEANAYRTLHDWYLAHGNRPAACICALKLFRASVQEAKEADDYSARKSKHLQTLDSLITEYQDLKECGELSIERYHFMEQAEDVTAEQKMNYINYALQHWGAWPRMNILRNAQNQLTLPSFTVNIGDGVQLPNTPRRVEVRQLVNCQKLTMTVSRLDINGDTSLSPSNETDYQKLRKLIVASGPQQTVTRRYVGQPEYKVIEDSMTIEGLPVGVYLVEFNTERTNMRTERMLLRVSDLYVIHEVLPDQRIRFVVVNATTGRPVPGAHIRVTTDYYSRNNEERSKTLTTDAKGEAEYEYTNRIPTHIYAYTDKDKASPDSYGVGRFYYYNNLTDQRSYHLLTDRKLYRPGQTVHVAVIAMLTEQHLNTSVMAHEQLTLTLRDANHEIVKEQKVVTDEYGKASADFVLPQKGLTGQFSISTRSGTTYFSVEEYKRPTFQVLFDEVTEKYQDGDTVAVTGRAESYAGVPVQGARVKYKVVRRRASWWWWSGNEDEKNIVTDTLVTDEDGRFVVNVPMHLPAAGRKADSYSARYYSFAVEADVTDAAGESRHGETSLPLSNKATAFSVNIPAKNEADKTCMVTFSYLNNGGNPIPGDVIYKILKANGEQGSKSVVQTAKATPANEPFKMDFNTLKSGNYILEAVCGEDTLSQSFIVFSMKDKRPAIETHDWFYASATEFPRDGGPVYVQMGSSDENQHIVYTILSGETLLESGTIDQSNAITTRQFTWREEYGDGILLTCAWVRNGMLYSHQTQISKPLPDKRLKLSWKTFRDRLTPGQKEQWTMHIERADGTSANEPFSLLAVLFDRSLDDIRRHSWPFGINIWRSLPSAKWQGRSASDQTLYGEQPYRNLYEGALSFTHFCSDIFDFSPRIVFHHDKRYGRLLRKNEPLPLMSPVVEEAAGNVEVMQVNDAQMSAKGDIGALDAAGNSRATDDEGETEGKGQNSQMRENLNETAFFYPTLLTDDKGDVDLSFTLPESITTWRFMGLANDKDVRFGTLESEVVAKKDVMIQPNMPRFLRLGDLGQVAARIFNTGEQDLKGSALMELLDPETEKVVYTQTQPFCVEAGKTTSVRFNVAVTDETFGNHPLLICRMSATAGDFSDGEQHYLPVLPNHEMVLNTVPFTQHGPGVKTIDLQKLIRGKVQKDGQNIPATLTVEYTNNPAWLMIQALPTVAQPSNIDAISQAVAYYANSLAARLLHLSPNIKTTIEQWKQEEGKETSLMSSLEKNQELKTLVLEETPWVADAHHESDQKQRLGDYFDENAVNYRLESNLTQLNKLQNADGSWSWWPGMRGSIYMTVAISKMLVRLNILLSGLDSDSQQMVSNNKHDNMLKRAYSFMNRWFIEEVKEMKKLEKKGMKNVRPSELAISWLYLTSLDGRKLSSGAAEAKSYLVNKLSKLTKDFTIYGKANTSIILAKNGYEQKAKEFLQSIREYTVYQEEMGRYFDTRNAYYSWFDYKIPTEVAAIEAIRMLQPKDEKTVEEMQRWLLQEKRTQSWDTPINAVNSVYAFLYNNMNALDSPDSLTVLKVDGHEIETSKATAGLGYVKATERYEPFNKEVFTADKHSEGTSWGAVYVQSMQPTTNIADAQSGLKVKREVLVTGNSGAKEYGKEENGVTSLKVGDRIRIRITIEAERDYDFVQVIDKRAACLEPIGQLSGYHWGYYCAPRDNATNYYFDQMAKGTHIVETEYFVDREGTYQTGTCTVQCAYSPEYTARTGAKVFKVTK